MKSIKVNHFFQKDAKFAEITSIISKEMPKEVDEKVYAFGKRKKKPFYKRFNFPHLSLKQRIKISVVFISNGVLFFTSLLIKDLWHYSIYCSILFGVFFCLSMVFMLAYNIWEIESQAIGTRRELKEYFAKGCYFYTKEYITRFCKLLESGELDNLSANILAEFTLAGSLVDEKTKDILLSSLVVNLDEAEAEMCKILLHSTSDQTDFSVIDLKKLAASCLQGQK